MEQEHLVNGEVSTQEDQGSSTSPTGTVPATITSSSASCAPLMSEQLANLLTRDTRVGYPSQYKHLSPFLHGWFRSGNLTMLSRLLSKQAKCVIELGAWLGRSTKFICERCPEALIFSVDLWSNEYFQDDDHYNKTDPEFAQILRSNSIYDQFLSNLATYQLKEVASSSSASTSASSSSSEGGSKGLIPMKMDTMEALKILHSMGVQPDLIYIDASHHYDFVVNEVNACLDFFPNAILVGDDWDNKDVRNAVEDVAKVRKQSIYVQGNTCWTFSREKVLQIIEQEQKQAADEKKQAEFVQQIRSKRGFEVDSLRALLKKPKK